MTVYGYARVSTLLQAREGESLEAQGRQIRAYGESKGLAVVDDCVFVEAGVSGGTEFARRPQGGRLLAELQTGDTVIFPKLDRAFRNTRDALNVLHQLKEAGVQAHFIDLGGDVTGNGVGAIVFTILSAFATFERERIATRIREVKQIKRAQGKFTGGRRQFGYEIVDGVRVGRADEQRVIRSLQRRRAKGASYRELSSWLAKNQAISMTPMGVRHVLLGSVVV